MGSYRDRNWNASFASQEDATNVLSYVARQVLPELGDGKYGLCLLPHGIELPDSFNRRNRWLPRQRLPAQSAAQKRLL